MSLNREITGVEPITLNEAKQQCYIPITDDDSTTEALLNSMISAARRYGENRTWRTLIDSTYTWKLDEFPSGVFEVPRPPLISVESIKYLDGDGVLQTVDASDYVIDAGSEPGRIQIDTDHSWPSTRDELNAVTIEFKSGYGDTDGTPNTSNVPEDIKIALRMYIKFLYDNRDSHVLIERSGEYHEAPVGTNFLLDMYSVRT